MTEKIKASIISAVTEIIVTHPIDYVKTILQNNNNINYREALKTPYKGLTSRLIGIVPMRVLFWNSLEYFKSNNYNKLNASILTSIIQTTVDYPIEQIKTQKMIHNCNFIDSFRNVKIIPSCGVHLFRNIGFTVCVNHAIQIDPNSLYLGAVGGFAGSLLTHPLDSLKTWYQAGNKNFPKSWTLKRYMTGWQYRCSVSFLSMNIGWIVFNRLKENI